MKSKFLPFLLLLAVLPVLIFRDYTPSNELRYLSIVDEALRNGDIFTFTNHGIQYADKPPLYFWILMLGKWLLGNHAMWFASLFSFLFRGLYCPCLTLEAAASGCEFVSMRYVH